MINQELLRTFVCVADSQTFSDAANRQRVTKSAISQQIKTLETQLGVALFERVGRRALLTESGQQLAHAFRGHLHAIDDAVAAVASAHGDVRGNIRIGSPRPFARVWLPHRVTHLLREHPALNTTLVFGTPTELERRLADRALDFAILVRDPELPGIDAETILWDPLESTCRHASLSIL